MFFFLIFNNSFLFIAATKTTSSTPATPVKPDQSSKDEKMDTTENIAEDNNNSEVTQQQQATQTQTPTATVNGTPNSSLDNNNSKNDKGLPKAMVKPQVLTHIIEGFVIHESNEPFAVNRQRYPDRDTNDEPPSKFYLFYIYFMIVYVM